MLHVSLKKRKGKKQGNCRSVSLILIPGKYGINFQASSKFIEGYWDTVTKVPRWKCYTFGYRTLEGHDWRIENSSFGKLCSTELCCDPVVRGIFIKILDDRRVRILTESSDNTNLGEAASVWEDRVRI